MAIDFWSPATLYQPGALVQRRSTPPVVQSAPTNGELTAPSGGWTFENPSLSIVDAAGALIPPFNGTYCIALGTGLIAYSAINTNAVPVTPGQVINAGCYVNTTGQPDSGKQGVFPFLRWYNSGMVNISDTPCGGVISRTNQGWQATGGPAVAPVGAAFAAIAAHFFRNEDNYGLGADGFIWDYTYSAPPDGLVFRAIQTDAATSAATEPVWPVVPAGTVVDGGVTWEAVVVNRVTWEANPILVSGGSEPTWPDSVSNAVVDNTIAWIGTTGQVTDEKCPNTASVAIAASKIFAADDDIVAFTATINPLDWSSRDDAGYLPFGLQTYGSTPVTALGLYRSNLVVFNSQSFQMWQVDQDPANMALLDSVPIGCTYPKTVQPLANDLIFLSAVGARNVGIAGASTNLQADGVGEPIDVLTLAKIRANVYEPFGLYWPAAGQYWLVFGDEAFVLTINGVKDKNWSRYTFPYVITDWTLHGSSLYLRVQDAVSGEEAYDAVWEVDAEEVMDDVRDPGSVFTVGGGD